MQALRTHGQSGVHNQVQVRRGVLAFLENTEIEKADSIQRPLRKRLSRWISDCKHCGFFLEYDRAQTSEPEA